MANLPQVMLLGNSVLMDSVANRLVDVPIIDVVRINTESDEFQDLASALSPDLIIYDYDTKFTNLLHSFLSQHPGTPLLAIDLFCSQVLVIDSKLHPTQSMQELCDLIKREVQRCSRRKEVQ